MMHALLQHYSNDLTVGLKFNRIALHIEFMCQVSRETTIT